MKRILCLAIIGTFTLLMNCLCFADSKTPVKSVAPEQAAENYDKEKYDVLIKRYRELTQKQKRIDAEARKNDSGYARAKEWEEKESSETEGKHRIIEKKFTDTLSKDDLRKYQQWKNLFHMVDDSNIYNEWSEYPNSHKPILLFAGAMTQSTIENISKNHPDFDKTKIIILKDNDGNHEEKIFKSHMEDCRKSLNDYLSNITKFNYQKVEEELNIPIELKQAIHKDNYISWKHLIYTTYIRVNAPKELEEIRKELRPVINELTTVRPGWQWAEGIWQKRPDISKEMLSPRNNIGWVNIILIIIEVVLIGLVIYFKIHEYIKRKKL
ncbi:MAG: hypothetical protein LBJ67_16820 [Planctomycetaceae bacterium]|jgi:hypothetical protein|nr:hypothetical protein [Planctomycetaceae bacterium]